MYCDANHGDDRDGGSESDDEKWKSQGGSIILIGDNMVSWRSRRHKARTLSSMESEYMEGSEAAKEVIWFRCLMVELDFSMSSPAVMASSL